MTENQKIPFTDLHAQYLECKAGIDSAIADVIARSDFITGLTVDRFEQAICAYTGAEDCASIGSGTNALVCALRACGIGPGDQVYTVSHTFVSTTEAIANVGATPVFIDIDEYYLMDTDQIKLATNPKAILFVDLYGQTPDIDKIKKFAREYDLYVIEDAAQSFGSSYRGKKVGSIADLTCFSFNPVKNLGAMGDAGAVTGSKELIDKVRMYRDHGRTKKYEYDAVGYNSRIDNLQAVILLEKLKKLDSWLEQKRTICRRYSEELKNFVKVPKETEWSEHTYYVYVIETLEGTRDALQKYLNDKGISTNVHYKFPTHKTKAFESYVSAHTKVPRTEYVCNNILSLPCYHTLKTDDQNYIIQSIKDFYNEN